MEKQLTVFDAVIDYLTAVEPAFILGIAVIGVMLYGIFRERTGVHRVRTLVVSFLLYYYAYIMFESIVGIPTIREWIRLAGLGEKIFHPELSLIPFSDGISFSFVMNIFMFVPLGIFLPILSRKYVGIQNTLLFAGALSLIIELSQMFTLHRATDINDLITNVLGAALGCLCFRVLENAGIRKHWSGRGRGQGGNQLSVLPVMIVAAAFVVVFVS